MSQHDDRSRLYTGVIPYIAVKDARAAVAFYQQAFGAKQHGELTTDQNGVVMNAEIEINGGMVMLMDQMDMTFGDAEAASSASSGKVAPAMAPNVFTMQLVTDKGRMWFDRAVAAGCTVTMPFAPQFWGDTYGRLRDPFGIDWAINEPSAESMAKAEKMASANG